MLAVPEGTVKSRINRGSIELARILEEMGVRPRLAAEARRMTDWNCVLTEERLSDYLDGLLSPAEAAAFSAHAGGCDPCGKLVAQVGGLVQQMQRARAARSPAAIGLQDSR